MLRRLIQSLSCGLSANDPAAAGGTALPGRTFGLDSSLASMRCAHANWRGLSYRHAGPASQAEQAQSERAVATSAPAPSAALLSSPDFPLPPPDYIRQHGESLTTGFVIAQVYKVEWRGVLLVAKWGEWVWPTEGTACAFVGSQSSVPVAKVRGSGVCSFTSDSAQEWHAHSTTARTSTATTSTSSTRSCPGSLSSTFATSGLLPTSATSSATSSP